MFCRAVDDDARVYAAIFSEEEEEEILERISPRKFFKTPCIGHALASPKACVCARASEFLVVSHALVVVARIEIAKKQKKISRDAVSDIRKWCAPQSVS